ncbi:MAG: tetratricopeptide repeat protein [Bdellovibrionales bacterium]|nr:tetratricopeptide repeat protein [Bdellovibrionales bacterium]
MTRIATAASKQRKLVIAAGIVILAAALAGSLYLTKRSAFRSQASEALFKARTKLAADLKSYGDSLAPAKEAKKAESTAKDAKGKAAKKETPVAPSLEFAKFDVSEKLKDGVAALEKVAEDFPGTMAGFDARMELGGLYFDHATGPADYEHASQWFGSASTTAPGNEQTIAALYNLGYAQEALGKCADSVKTFDRALNSGSGPLLGELLLSKARCQETLGDKAGAKATYENVIKQLPNTESAKTAETKKATL